ncbi:glycosyltransferase family 8 protein [Aerococcus kribbianus]|uniref:Glycosyltransferase family 8 protein n=1 Tax=Aerococcus kribbianus TaxID=2999064 RepID=A0A9X3JEN5_9LACT|nr:MULTISPECIES: glycosyltransferase family 8 protein [unclassified Aerococcus]MCZ0716793.1 glycosyltransferase family 8 protein [Aerococcus sp. YH-aer221]MCZ0725081.1 glycosyltransferase family 8 protein [Aerococcus sp. YH-aer222]
MNLLFCINDNYVDQFKVTLYSLIANTSVKDIKVFIMQNPVLARNVEIKQFCQKIGATYHPIVVDSDSFQNVPITDRYPETIYYRLLAQDYLPEDLDRILYLDADILCINEVKALYTIDMGQAPYAAASHTDDSELTTAVNRWRLGNYDSASYYNSGVLLMNLKVLRDLVSHQEIMAYINDMGNRLFLPDQDILTALYGHNVINIPDEIYNYDTRYQLYYAAKSKGEWDLDWVMAHTVFLHFCGRIKPWKSKNSGIYSSLYKHYAHLANN